MNELKIDNPAQRLLDILSAGQKIATHNSCRKAWQAILKIEDGNEGLLITRMGLC
jgi:hypothetical protein